MPNYLVNLTRLIWFIYVVVAFIIFHLRERGALSRLVYLLRELLLNQSILYTLCALFLFVFSIVANLCPIIELYLIIL